MDQKYYQNAYIVEQGMRAKSLFSAIVLAALDDAVVAQQKSGDGSEKIARWALSSDGKTVLSCAGIDPNERVIKGLMRFVSSGVRTSASLTRAQIQRSLENQNRLHESAT